MKTFRRLRLTGELVHHAHEGFALTRQFRRHGPRHLAPGATRTALMIAAEAGRQADLAIAAPNATPRAPERAKGSAITPPESEAKAMPKRSNADGSEPMPPDQR